MSDELAFGDLNDLVERQEVYVRIIVLDGEGTERVSKFIMSEADFAEPGASEQIVANYLKPAWISLKAVSHTQNADFMRKVQIPPRFKYGGGAGCGGHASKDELPLTIPKELNV